MHSALPKSTAPRRRAPSNPSVFIWIFGIVLPIAALLLESTIGVCRATLFDPLPTLFHVALFATIPLANLRMVFALRDKTPLSRPWAWLHAMSFGVAIAYSVVLLPVMPIALLGILFYGLGVLALAPLCAVICAFLGRRALKLRTRIPQPVLGYGIALGLAMFIAAGLPTTITGIGVRMAASAAPETRLRGMDMLRAAGSEEALLRLSYRGASSGTDLVGLVLDAGGAISPHQAREVFFQLTGAAFNSRPAPDRPRTGFYADEVFEADGERATHAPRGNLD